MSTRLNDSPTTKDFRLGQCPKGWRGIVSGLVSIEGLSIPWSEMERRLLEMGFVEGAALEILHDGPIQHDPIAVRVDDITIAVRRADANAILVRPVE
ncbi:FeoA family protein [Telmatospirillum sp.]|uniref:FeoA family protein n=1 Tax=Telmatospirillum sp. TaxID=2079197 RepID=UPI002840C796|nr:FeoA family protein [Telmatospirillum sp.]MDR3440940.1 FeoA family protein [Telmatospirillum sp.]